MPAILPHSRKIIFISFLLFYLLGDSIAQDNNSIIRVSNKLGPVLGYSASSGIKLLTVNGLHFKDLNRNGKLDKYEDWRLSVDERAKDLASKMTVEQIAGLMLYSGHQSIPGAPKGFGAATYNGKPFAESGAKASEITDQQRKFLTDDNLRHVLVTRVQTPEIAAQWNNNIQALLEGLGLGIPSNTLSPSPRRSPSAWCLPCPRRIWRRSRASSRAPTR